MGQSNPWWWQLQGPRSVQECPADFCHGVCFCCHVGRWKHSDLGRSKPWQWQLQGPRSAQECPADFCHGVCFCCHFGRWKRGDLGRSKLWWWQLQGPRSAQECPADFCHGIFLCCHFGRWNRGDLGRFNPWRWQLQGRKWFQWHLDSCSPGQENVRLDLHSFQRVPNTWPPPQAACGHSCSIKPMHRVSQWRLFKRATWCDEGLGKLMGKSSFKSPRVCQFFAGNPIGSMYAIYGNIYHPYTQNVSIYTIHGSYGNVIPSWKSGFVQDIWCPWICDWYGCAWCLGGCLCLIFYSTHTILGFGSKLGTSKIGWSILQIDPNLWCPWP